MGGAKLSQTRKQQLQRNLLYQSLTSLKGGYSGKTYIYEREIQNLSILATTVSS
jgi:hypothetical protein